MARAQLELDGKTLELLLNWNSVDAIEGELKTSLEDGLRSPGFRYIATVASACIREAKPNEKMHRRRFGTLLKRSPDVRFEDVRKVVIKLIEDHMREAGTLDADDLGEEDDTPDPRRGDASPE